jgi:hypothetical protein
MYLQLEFITHVSCVVFSKLATILIKSCVVSHSKNSLRLVADKVFAAVSWLATSSLLLMLFLWGSERNFLVIMKQTCFLCGNVSVILSVYANNRGHCLIKLSVITADVVGLECVEVIPQAESLLMLDLSK